MQTMEQLEADVMSYDDYIYEGEVKEDSDFSGKDASRLNNLNGWLEELKKVWLLYSFVDRYGPQFTESGRLLHSHPSGDGSSNLLFLTSFLGESYQKTPYFVQKTQHWKEVSIMVFYHCLYLAPPTAWTVRLQCASYLLQNFFRHAPLLNCLLPDLQLIRDHLVERMETENDWDAFDLLHRVAQEFSPVFSPLYSEIFSDSILSRLHTFRYTASSRRPTPSTLASHPTFPLSHVHPMYNVDTIRTLRERFNNATLPLIEDNQANIENQENIGNQGNQANNIMGNIQSIYDDSQNVHNTSINESVKKNILVLYREYEDRYTIDEALMGVQEYFIKKKLYTPRITEVLSRIQTDPYLVCDNPFIYARDILRCLWGYIQSQLGLPSHEELLNRLYEEISEAHRTCFSGHISRLVNVVVGFHPEIHISISKTDQLQIYLKKVVHSALQKLLEDKPEKGEKVLNDMTEEISQQRTKKKNAFRIWVIQNREFILKKVKENWVEDSIEDSIEDSKDSNKESIESIEDSKESNKESKDSKDSLLEMENMIEKIWNTMFPAFPGLLKLSSWQRSKIYWKNYWKNYWKKKK